MDAVAKTSEPWVAYKYDAGLNGFSTDLTPRVTWRDTGGRPQPTVRRRDQHDARAREGAEPACSSPKARAARWRPFTPPHTFFFTREVDTNLGYVWYRKDADGRRSASASARPTREEDPQYVENFALFNAPPGTVQRMGVYFYASPEPAERDAPGGAGVHARRHVQAVAGLQDVREPLPPAVHRPRQRASGSFDTPIQDLVAMKALGLNIVGLSDFHGDLHAERSGSAAASRIRRTTSRRRAARRTPISSSRRGRSRARSSAATTTSCSRSERVLVEGAAAGTAVHRGRSGLRQGLPHRQRRRRAADDGRGRRLLVPRASAHQGHDRLSRT